MNSKKYFILLLTLYTLVRVPLMLSNQVLSDELDIGAIVKEFTHLPHLSLPILDYQKQPYGSASLFDAAWATPFFLLFGDTLFSLKLAAFGWYLFPLIAWFYVWKGFFSPNRAFWMLVFFVFSPEIVFYSLVNGHQHFEVILWTALNLLLFRQFLQGRFGEIRGGLLLGLFAGFVSWLNIVNVVTPVLLCLYLFFLKEDKTKKGPFFLAYIPMFLIGFSPLIVYNLRYGMETPGILEDIFVTTDYSFGSFVQRGLWVFGRAIPGLFVFQKFEGSPKLLLTGLFSSFYLASLVFLFWKKKKSLFFFKGEKGFDIEVFGLFYQILFIFTMLLSRKFFSKEYLLPMVPFMGMTLEIGFSQFYRAFGERWRVRLKQVVISFCMVAWFLGDLSLIRWSRLGEAFHIQGYSYALFAQHSGSQFHWMGGYPLFQKKIEALLKNHTEESKKRLWCFALRDLPDSPMTGSKIKAGSSDFENLGRAYLRRWLYGSADVSCYAVAVINILERERWDWFDKGSVVEVFARLDSKEKREQFNWGVEEEALLQIEDDYLRKKILKELQVKDPKSL